DAETDALRKRMHAPVQAVQVVDFPRSWKCDRRQRPRRRGAFGGQVTEREGQGPPSGVFRAHPVEVEVHALDEHVAAGDRESVAILQHRGIVLARLSSKERPDPLEQTELSEPFDLHWAMSMARRRRAAISGSGESATARMTQARRRPSPVSCETFDSSMPPIANTGTLTALVTATTPFGPMTPLSFLTGVGKAGPQPM